VAINSREEERPRMVIDFFLCEDLFISVLLSFSHHPRMLTRPVYIRGLAMAQQPQMRLIKLRGMPLWCGMSGASANQSRRESEILRKIESCG
jgi:hypothetical protein